MRVGQKRSHSVLESVANVAVGFAVGVASNWIVLPLFGYAVTPADSVSIAVVFTLISLVRSYVLRRAFNLWTIRDGRSANGEA